MHEPSSCSTQSLLSKLYVRKQKGLVLQYYAISKFQEHESVLVYASHFPCRKDKLKGLQVFLENCKIVKEINVDCETW